jgi:hypothetical protein
MVSGSVFGFSMYASYDIIQRLNSNWQHHLLFVWEHIQNHYDLMICHH